MSINDQENEEEEDKEYVCMYVWYVLSFLYYFYIVSITIRTSIAMHTVVLVSDTGLILSSNP